MWRWQAKPLAWVAAAEPWIRIDPPAGTTNVSSALTVDVGARALTPGFYAGRLTVTPQAGGPERAVGIQLEVTSGAGTPKVSPSGVIFRMGAGEAAAEQILTIHNPSAAVIEFVSSWAPMDEAGWLAYGPASDWVEAGGSAEISLGVSASALPAGVRRGALTFEFSDGTLRVVDVMLAIRSAVCQPARLVPQLTRTAQHFAARVGWPEPIEVRILDDCGGQVDQVTGIVSFSGGREPSLPLTPLGNGIFTSAWTPWEARPSITLTVTASDPSGGLSGTVQATGSVAGESPVGEGAAETRGGRLRR